MKLFLAIACFFVLPGFVSAQTYTHTSNTPIPDYGQGQVLDPISVSGLAATINNSFGVKEVIINITHTYDADLSIYLRAPDGTEIPLAQSVGGGGDNFTNTHFNYTTTNPISSGNPPFTGNFMPLGMMGQVNNGQNPNGTWKLRVIDEAAQDTGILLNWSINFGTSPAQYFTDTTRLPIICINSLGNVIVDEPKVTAWMRIIDNGPGALNRISDSAAYVGYVGIEYRGSTSQTFFPQKPFAVETRDNLGNSMDTTILAMPKGSDWVFQSTYNDKSLMRNALTYTLGREMTHYSSRSRFFELYVNGSYEGIYLLNEKIKRDNNRCNITKADSLATAGLNLTGGYIIKIDKTTGFQNDGWYGINTLCDTLAGTYQQLYYQYHYPSSLKISQPEKNYIQQYMQHFEYAVAHINLYDTLNGYRKYASLPSFIDHSLIVELSRNVDGYRLSSFYHKDRDDKGGKLKAGPLWDYNLSYGNADYLQGSSCDVWQWDLVCPGNPIWWQRLFEQDSIYHQEYKCRYTNWRHNVLSWQNINHVIDSFETTIHYQQAKHFNRWPILGVYVWPNAWYPPTHQQEIDTLKNWIVHRLAWMDTQLLDTSCTYIDYTDPYFGTKTLEPLVSQNINLYPNPVLKNNSFSIALNNNYERYVRVEIHSITGSLLYAKSLAASTGLLQLEGLDFASGVYFVTVKSSAGRITKKLILQ